MILARQKYLFQALQKDNFWLPPALMLLFLILATMFEPARRYDLARSFLGFLLPLLPGGLSAYAFLADPALEMQFATRQSAAAMIRERLSAILLVIFAIAVLFQLGMVALSVSLGPLGNLWQRQLVWLVPCIASLALGAAAGLLAHNSSAGFAFVGGMWIVQLMTRGWFASHPVWRNVLLFYGVMDPSGDPLQTNQLSLLVVSLVLLLISHLLLKKQERYL